MNTIFKPVLNEVTHKEDLNFSAKLISIGSKELENTNGNKYVVGTIEFVTPDGEKVQRSTQIYAKSLEKGMEAGGSYLCTAQQGEDGQVYIRTSHLVVAERAQASDFGSLFGVLASAKAEAGDIA